MGAGKDGECIDLHAADGAWSPEPAILVDLPSILKGLGLSNSESLVLGALLKLRSGTAAEVAATAGIGRANAYPLLESLRTKNVIDHRPGKVSRWTATSHDNIVRQLASGQMQRLQEAAAHVESQAEEALRALARLDSGTSQRPDYFHVVTNALQTGSIYNRHLGEADEVLVCNREPYPGQVQVVDSIIVALARGITARALYRTSELEEREDLRRTARLYREAGVESRSVDDIPVALAVFDRKVALAMLRDPAEPERGLMTLYAEHAAFAETCARAFEQMWAEGQPLTETDGAYMARPSTSAAGGNKAATGVRG